MSVPTAPKTAATSPLLLGAIAQDNRCQQRGQVSSNFVSFVFVRTASCRNKPLERDRLAPRPMWASPFVWP